MISTDIVLDNEFESLAIKFTPLKVNVLGLPNYITSEHIKLALVKHIKLDFHLNGLSTKCTDGLFFLQIVCSFLVRDMGIDWRMGAEWFETCLLDYDPCSNYGNWTYGAGNSISFQNMKTSCLNSHAVFVQVCNERIFKILIESFSCIFVLPCYISSEKCVPITNYTSSEAPRTFVAHYKSPFLNIFLS